MRRSEGDKAQEGRYGKDVLAECPAWTREHILGLRAHDDDDKESDMSSLTDTDFQDALGELEDKLLGHDRLRKSVAGLEADVDDLRGEVTARASSHDAELARLHRKIADLANRGVSVDHMYEALARLWRDVHHERAEAQMDAEEPDELTKSVASFLQPGDTRAHAQRVAQWVVKSFGRRGGQRLAYDRELASQLLCTKSITREEHQNWKTFGRLPDGVGLGRSAGRAQPMLDAQVERNMRHAAARVHPLAAFKLLRG
jgi:hypothetical protein